MGLVLKFGELNDDDDEPDAQTTGRSIVGEELNGKFTAGYRLIGNINCHMSESLNISIEGRRLAQ